MSDPITISELRYQQFELEDILRIERKPPITQIGNIEKWIEFEIAADCGWVPPGRVEFYRAADFDYQI